MELGGIAFGYSGAQLRTRQHVSELGEKQLGHDELVIAREPALEYPRRCATRGDDR